MPSINANRLKVRDAWEKGGMYHATNFETVGGLVYSYHHIIGVTDPDGKRTAFDCHYSPTTTAHCHALFPAADVIQPCPKHPKRGQSSGPPPEDTTPFMQYRDDLARYRNGIEGALGTLILLREGNAKYHGITLETLDDGLRRLLEGKNYYADPT